MTVRFIFFAVTLRRCRTISLDVAGLTSARALLHNVLGKLFTPLCLCHKAVTKQRRYTGKVMGGYVRTVVCRP